MGLELGRTAKTTSGSTRSSSSAFNYFDKEGRDEKDLIVGLRRET